MKLAFEKDQVVKGALFEDLFYNQVIIPLRRRYSKQGRILVEVDEDQVPFSFLSANKDYLLWEGVSIFVEVPVSYKTTTVPTWLPNRTYLDENDDEQIHNLESWGGVIRENLAGTRMIVKLSQIDDVIGSNFDSLVAFIEGAATRIGMTVKETRDLIATPAYTIPE